MGNKVSEETAASIFRAENKAEDFSDGIMPTYEMWGLWRWLWRM